MGPLKVVLFMPIALGHAQQAPSPTMVAFPLVEHQGTEVVVAGPPPACSAQVFVGQGFSVCQQVDPEHNWTNGARTMVYRGAFSSPTGEPGYCGLVCDPLLRTAYWSVHIYGKGFRGLVECHREEVPTISVHAIEPPVDQRPSVKWVWLRDTEARLLQEHHGPRGTVFVENACDPE